MECIYAHIASVKETSPPTTVSSSLSVSTLVAAVLFAVVIDTSPFWISERTHSVAGAATLAQRCRRSCEAVHPAAPNPTFRDGRHTERPSPQCLSSRDESVPRAANRV
jgi:hypothetical protein